MYFCNAGLYWRSIRKVSFFESIKGSTTETLGSLRRVFVLFPFMPMHLLLAMPDPVLRFCPACTTHLTRLKRIKGLSFKQSRLGELVHGSLQCRTVQRQSPFESFFIVSISESMSTVMPSSTIACRGYAIASSRSSLPSGSMPCFFAYGSSALIDLYM